MIGRPMRITTDSPSRISLRVTIRAFLSHLVVASYSLRALSRGSFVHLARDDDDDDAPPTLAELLVGTASSSRCDYVAVDSLRDTRRALRGKIARFIQCACRGGIKISIGRVIARRRSFQSERSALSRRIRQRTAKLSSPLAPSANFALPDPDGYASDRQAPIYISGEPLEGRFTSPRNCADPASP